MVADWPQEATLCPDGYAKLASACLVLKRIREADPSRRPRALMHAQHRLPKLRNIITLLRNSRNAMNGGFDWTRCPGNGLRPLTGLPALLSRNGVCRSALPAAIVHLI